MSLWVEKTIMWWPIAHNRCGEAVLRDATTAYKVDVDVPNGKKAAEGTCDLRGENYA
jgi:hypothetical protein